MRVHFASFFFIDTTIETNLYCYVLRVCYLFELSRISTLRVIDQFTGVPRLLSFILFLTVVNMKNVREIKKTMLHWSVYNISFTLTVC